eukprot:SAG31_NODE_2002_length_6689_cov_120.013202_6_plen_80_part_00
MLVLGGPAALRKRCVASVCRPYASVSACCLCLLRCVLCCCRGGCCSRAILAAGVVMQVCADAPARALAPRISFVVCALC